MSGFVIGAAILACIALGVVLRPLWLSRQASTPPSNGPDETPLLRILREQRGELDAALSDGIIDTEQHTNSINELAQRALAESVPQFTPQRNTPHRTLAAILGLTLLASSGLFYQQLGNPAALDPAQREAPPQIGREQITAMVDKLATRLAAQPNDAQGWLMLGRSYMVLGRFKEASDTFAHLAQLHPNSASVLADWADALANATDGKVSGEPEKLVAKALAVEPDNVKALALAGTAAFEQARFNDAITLWEKMASRVDPQSETGQSAQTMIAEARTRMGAPKTADTATLLTATGVVELAGTLKAKASPDDVVFIYARSPAGGPPLAAMRLTVADLPAQFDFAHAALMSQAGPRPDKIIIGARVSKSGNVIPAKGDLQGITSPVAPDARGLRLIINTTLTQ
jgi:cytochrome c-type biogenesis protein CcmH